MAETKAMQEVGIAKVGIIHAQASMLYTRIPIKLGQREAAVILSLRHIMRLSNVTQVVIAGILKRSSGELQGGDWTTDEEVIWATNFQSTIGAAPTEMTQNSRIDDFHFPFPVTVVRSPQIFTYSTVVTAVVHYFLVYYLKFKVDDVAMAQMLVKDHE